jgi:hypothetical protein
VLRADAGYLKRGQSQRDVAAPPANIPPRARTVERPNRADGVLAPHPNGPARATRSGAGTSLKPRSRTPNNTSGFRRFTSRGINRATAGFSFHAVVHNLLKAIGTGALASTPS